VLKAFELQIKSQRFWQCSLPRKAPLRSASARQTKLDIIVLDVNFPIDFVGAGLQWMGSTSWNGSGGLMKLPMFPRSSSVPAKPAKFKEKAIAAGAVAFFQKPINYADFVTEVRRCIG